MHLPSVCTLHYAPGDRRMCHSSEMLLVVIQTDDAHAYT